MKLKQQLQLSQYMYKKHDRRERNRAYQMISIHIRKKNMLSHLKDSTSGILMQNKLTQLSLTILDRFLTFHEDRQRFRPYICII